MANPPGGTSCAQDSARPDDGGATAVEYALMVSLITLVIFGAVAVLGLNLGDLFGNAATSFESF